MTVTVLRGVRVVSDRRAFFHTEVAAAFDRYVADYGREPDAFVMVQGGIRQPARVNWTAQGETEASMNSMLALAQAVILKEIINPD